MHRFASLTFTAALGAAALMPLAASAVELPTRKAGLWEITTQGDGKRPAHSMQQCIDAATDEAMQRMSQGMSRDMCSRNSISGGGGHFVTESVCKMGGSTVTSRGEVKGDFQSAYSMRVESKFEPAFLGQSTSVTQMEARWIGACKADQKPGDVIMPGGMKVNVKEMMGRGK